MKHLPLAIAMLFASSAPVLAQTANVLRADSFRIGSSGVECSAQNRSADSELKNMFDRAFSVVCRDAASSVGKLTIARGRAAEPVTTASMTCEAAKDIALPGISGASRTDCLQTETGLRYVRYIVSQSQQSYLAEGLAGYDSAIQLGLRSIILGRAVPGSVEVAVTEAGDSSAFARIQAGNLDPDQALSEGYGRNNTGNFPEAAEFFDTLMERSRSGGAGFSKNNEYVINQALQLSNLGKTAEANALFKRAQRDVDQSDPVLIRLLRNYRMMHELNGRDGDEAIKILSDTASGRTGAILDETRLTDGFLDRPIVQRLNNEDGRIAALGGGGGRLSITERSLLLDAQALHLQGAALRLLGRVADAKTAQNGAISRVLKVRDGKVASAIWLRASALVELASLAELSGGGAGSRSQLDEAIQLYRTYYPGSAAQLGAQARLAALLARSGAEAESRNLFKETVASSINNAGVSANVRGYLPSYFDLLAADSGGTGQAAADFFLASQMLVRPGVAQTQAVFARELSGGSDEASRLFRQSLNLSRELVRLDADTGRLAALGEPTAEEVAALEVAKARRAALGNDQTALLSKLAEYPRFKAVSDGQTSLESLQKALGNGEGYYKLVIVDARVFGLFVTGDYAQLVRLSITPEALSSKVAALRDSIVRLDSQGGVTVDPFDIVTARALYVDLFGPLDGRVAKLDHLIFEPDGPMLQLPANLLVAEQAGVDAYLARSKMPNADDFDFRGVAWLGRKQIVTTAVSPKAFIDVRSVPASKGTRDYLGLGQNAPVPASATAMVGQDSCDWPIGLWGNPISSDELRFASNAVGAGRSDLMIQSDFTDAALLARTDLRDFRILHFATHGLVTAPSPACPARPSLVTSFAPEGSDGLLSFKEIFDLQLDADLVILSACDTAGMASVSATREAGVATGGNFAMDGLVRAFVAAGARSVIASHWPVPDDYDATKTLMQGLFSAKPGESAGAALQRTHISMMDNPLTSHPYYWSGFAVIGDASKAVTPK
jgi:CHAT domain-containing protein